MNKVKGFTLVELLIVVSILAILSGILISVINIQRVQGRARDSVRKEGLATIAGGLERYYADNNFYPAGTWVADLTTGTTVYIKPGAFPKDPSTNANYNYGQVGGNQNFCVCATLEVDPADRKSCPAGLGGTYCVINPF